MVKLLKFQPSPNLNKNAVVIGQIYEFESFFFSAIDFPKHNNVLCGLVYNYVAKRQTTFNIIIYLNKVFYLCFEFNCYYYNKVQVG